MRWHLLTLSVGVQAASFFCFDVPAVLHNTLKDHFADQLDGDRFELIFSGLYTVYCFFNIFIPPLLGSLKDKFGKRIILLLTSLMIVLAESIFSYGIMVKSLVIIFFGRMLLGVGVETQISILQGLYYQYFVSDYHAFGIGFNQLFGHSSSLANAYLTPRITITYGLEYALAFSVAVTVLGFLLALAIVSIELTCGPGDVQLIEYQPIEEQMMHEEEGISIKQLLGFLLNLQSHLVMCCFYAFVSISVGYFTENWESVTSELEASTMVVRMWLIVCPFSPILGILSDHYNLKKIFIGFYSVNSLLALTLTVHTQSLLSMVYYAFTLITIWLGLWPMMGEIAKKRTQGREFAYVVSGFNLVLCILQIVIGILRSTSGNFDSVISFLIAMTALGTAGGVIFLVSYHRVSRQAEGP